MNNSDHRRKTSGWLNGSRKWRFHILINVVFSLLIAVQWLSLDRYWNETLQPRLYLSAETQAAILARSQTTVLVETLEHTAPEHVRQELFNTLQEILIVTDLSTGKPMMAGVSLNLDGEELGLETDNVALSDGDMTCQECFVHSEALISRSGVLLGIADFAIRDHYYQLMSTDMKSRLFRESAVVLVLLVFVWGTMLVVFHRLHNAKRLTEASDRAKTRFLANVTHELRTPLNGILGYTQLLKEEPDLMQHHGKGINTIDRCADHLLLLINDILEFSRTDEDRITLSPQELHLPGFLQVLVEMNAIHANSRNLDFVCDFPEKLPSRIWADEKRLRQVLINLLGNAIKFTQEGNVKFVLSIQAQKRNSISLRFQVRDTGIGIAEQDLNAIFVPFQQLENPITRSEGSGLGLSISQKLVRLMGSKLEVTSELNNGSCFWFDMAFPVLGDEIVLVPEAVQWTPLQRQQNTETLIIPESDTMKVLLEAARAHNILVIREQVEILKEDERLVLFVERLTSFVDSYRFKPLVSWLEEQRKGGS